MGRRRRHRRAIGREASVDDRPAQRDRTAVVDHAGAQPQIRRLNHEDQGSRLSRRVAADPQLLRGPAGNPGTGYIGDQIGQGVSAIGSYPSKIASLWGTVFEGKPRDPTGAIGVVGIGRLGGDIAQSNAFNAQDKAFALISLLATVNLLLFFFNLLPLLRSTVDTWPVHSSRRPSAVGRDCGNARWPRARGRRLGSRCGQGGGRPPTSDLCRHRADGSGHVRGRVCADPGDAARRLRRHRETGHPGWVTTSASDKCGYWSRELNFPRHAD